MPTETYCKTLSARISKLEERCDELLKELTLLEIETRGSTFNCKKHVEMIETHMAKVEKELAPVVAHCKEPGAQDCGFCESIRRFFVRVFGKKV